MKKDYRKFNGFVRRGSFVLGLALAVSSLRAENKEEVSAVLFASDERNQLAEMVGPEIYNASAYKIMEAEIRKSLAQDSTLSNGARRIGVSICDGVVVLKGDVKNAAESEIIMQISRECAGLSQVRNQLAVEDI